jgi:hypothetical protein
MESTFRCLHHEQGFPYRHHLQTGCGPIKPPVQGTGDCLCATQRPDQKPDHPLPFLMMTLKCGQFLTQIAAPRRSDAVETSSVTSSCN